MALIVKKELAPIHCCGRVTAKAGQMQTITNKVVLARTDASQAYPFVGAGFLITLASGYFLLSNVQRRFVKILPLHLF